MADKAKVFAFYSYKGGTGRTTASANVSVLLSTRGHRVLCIDLDLEGPGIGIVFNLVEETPFPLQSYLEGNYELTSGDFIQHSLSQEAANTSGGVWVLPASTRLAGAVDTSKGGRLLGQLRKLIALAEREFGIDVVVIDSPSGFGDLSALSMYVSNCVVALFRYSRQHVLGTARVSDFVKKYKLEFIAAASCVPQTRSEEKAKYDRMLKRFYKTPIIEIEEDDSLKWQERIVVESSDNCAALAGYNRLADAVIAKL